MLNDVGGHRKGTHAQIEMIQNIMVKQFLQFTTLRSYVVVVHSVQLVNHWEG